MGRSSGVDNCWRVVQAGNCILDKQQAQWLEATIADYNRFMDGTVKCPAGHVLKVKSSLRGKQAACPACGTKFIVPAADASNGQQPLAQPQPAAQLQPTVTAAPAPIANNPTTAAAP